MPDKQQIKVINTDKPRHWHKPLVRNSPTCAGHRSGPTPGQNSKRQKNFEFYFCSRRTLEFYLRGVAACHRTAPPVHRGCISEDAGAWLREAFWKPVHFRCSYLSMANNAEYVFICTLAKCIWCLEFMQGPTAAYAYRHIDPSRWRLVASRFIFALTYTHNCRPHLTATLIHTDPMFVRIHA